MGIVFEGAFSRSFTHGALGTDINAEYKQQYCNKKEQICRF